MNTNAIVYDQMMQEITAIPPENILSPSMPMDVFIQEAHRLYHWAQTDKEQLLKAGLSEELLEDLPFRADAAAEAQNIWRNFIHGQSEAQQRWNAESPEAYELRDEIINAMCYAYRENIPLRTKVKDLSRHKGEFDLIADLHQLATMGRENPAPLRKVGFHLSKLEQAAMMSKGMGQIKHSASGSDGLVKRVRDQAYTYLKEAVDTVRDCGKYVFWKTPSRRKGYESDYAQKSRRSGEDATQPYVPPVIAGTDNK